MLDFFNWKMGEKNRSGTAEGAYAHNHLHSELRHPHAAARSLTVLILDHSLDNLWSASWKAWLTSLYVDEYTGVTQTEQIKSWSCFFLFSFFLFTSAQTWVCLLLQMHACCTNPSFTAIQSAKECRTEQECVRRRGLQSEGWGCGGLEQGFMTFNMICIIVCIACSVSTQSQHGWSVLICKTAP